MSSYRTTVILKTDIVGSTPRLAGHTQAEMSMERKQHRQFIAQTAEANSGSIFQEEGDSYWIEFPSVTDACFAAIEMHQNLRARQAGKGEKQRLAIRVVITVGDILHEGSDSMGMTMNQTARLEKITPPDEIYLSHAAWLVLNKAEVQTSFVSEFAMKGFAEPEKIYKVDQKHRVRVLTNQFVIFTDIRGWSGFTKANRVEEIEKVMSNFDDLLNDICDQHGGVLRNTSGDQYFMTFSEAGALFPAIENLCNRWKIIVEHYQLGLSVAIHKGDLNIIRSYLFSNDIHTTVFLERLNQVTHPDRKSISVTASNRVKESAKDTNWESKFQVIDIHTITDERLQSIAREYGAYLFIFEDDTPS